MVALAAMLCSFAVADKRDFPLFDPLHAHCATETDFPGEACADVFKRFVTAINTRLAKLLNAGLRRDQDCMLDIEPRWQRYLDARRLLPPGEPEPAEWTSYRWLIEELRVSLFAQELRTSVPVSPKRLDDAWEPIREWIDRQALSKR